MTILIDGYNVLFAARVVRRTEVVVVDPQLLELFPVKGHMGPHPVER